MSSYLYKYYYICVMYFLQPMNCSLRMLTKTIMFAFTVHSLKTLQLITGVHFMHTIYPLKKWGWEESKECTRGLILIPSKTVGSFPFDCKMLDCAFGFAGRTACDFLFLLWLKHSHLLPSRSRLTHTRQFYFNTGLVTGILKMHLTTMTNNAKGLEGCEELRCTENLKVFSKFSYLITSLVILLETCNSVMYCSWDYQTFKKKLIQIIALFCLIKLKINRIES